MRTFSQGMAGMTTQKRLLVLFCKPGASCAARHTRRLQVQAEMRTPGKKLAQIQFTLTVMQSWFVDLFVTCRIHSSLGWEDVIISLCGLLISHIHLISSCLISINLAKSRRYSFSFIYERRENWHCDCMQLLRTLRCIFNLETSCHKWYAGPCCTSDHWFVWLSRKFSSYLDICDCCIIIDIGIRLHTYKCNKTDYLARLTTKWFSTDLLIVQKQRVFDRILKLKKY